MNQQGYIVVTRPLKEGKKFVKKLKDLGYSVISSPTIDTTKTILSAEIQQHFSHLDTFDWIAFTSSNGVHFFMEALTEFKVDPSILIRKKIAVVGPKTAETLHKQKLTPSFIPSHETTDDLAKELPNVTGKKILLPRATIANPTLPKTLEKRGAIVVNMPIYKTSAVTTLPSSFIDSLQNNRILCITFTSPSTVKGFMENKDVQDFKERVVSLPIVSIGPVTTNAARHYGFKTIYTADPYTAEGMLTTLQKRIPCKST